MLLTPALWVSDRKISRALASTYKSTFIHHTHRKANHVLAKDERHRPERDRQSGHTANTNPPANPTPWSGEPKSLLEGVPETSVGCGEKDLVKGSAAKSQT